MALRLIVRRRRAGARPVKPSHPKAFFLTQSGLRYDLPYAPTESDHGGFAGSWAQLPRTGRKPLLFRQGLGLRSEQFTMPVGYRDGRPIGTALDVLRQIVQRGDRVTFSFGSPERGTWQVTDFTYRVTRRQPGTNEPLRADVTLTLTEVVVAQLRLGPVSGGSASGGLVTIGSLGSGGSGAVGGGGSQPAPKAPSGSGKPQGRAVPVQRGESIQMFSRRTTGHAGNWQAIARHNKIKDPSKLRAGQILYVPTWLTAKTGAQTEQAYDKTEQNETARPRPGQQ